jgi:hypothetical protein
MGADGMPPWFDSGEPPEASDELRARQPRRHLAPDVSLPPAVPVTGREVPGQAFVHVRGTEDQQVIARIQPARDVAHESPQVFEPVWLACGLWASAAVADGRIVPDVARRPVVRRHL